MEAQGQELIQQWERDLLELAAIQNEAKHNGDSDDLGSSGENDEGKDE